MLVSCGRNGTDSREHDVAVGVADRDRRRVAVAHQVDAVARHLERVVDAHLALAAGSPPGDLRGQVGDEVARLPGALRRPSGW